MFSRDWLGAANPGDLLGLDCAQEFHLEIHRHIADLIQHERTVVGILEQADLSLGIGSGKRAFLITEQLRFQQVSRNGSTVDLYIWFVVAQAPAVDLICDDLFPHARLPGNQNGRICGGDMIDQDTNLLQGAIAPTIPSDSSLADSLLIDFGFREFTSWTNVSKSS